MKHLGGLLLLLIATTVHAEPELDRDFPQSDLVISGDRACHHFGVWLALERSAWQRGLMHVRRMAANRGMLFIYPDDGMRSMWMKNTFIPLDIVFIRGDGSVSSVIENTEPQSLESLASTEPLPWVLELNAGTAARLGIGPGSTVTWAGDARPPSEN